MAIAIHARFFASASSKPLSLARHTLRQSNNKQCIKSDARTYDSKDNCKSPVVPPSQCRYRKSGKKCDSNEYLRGSAGIGAVKWKQHQAKPNDWHKKDASN